MGFQFYELTAEDQGRFVVSVSGSSGVGKTSFIGNILHPAMLPALIVDIDRGLSSITSMKGLPGVIAMQPDKTEALVTLPSLLKLPDSAPNKPEQLRGIKTVILDSLSAYQEETVMGVARSPQSDTKSKYQASQRDYLQAQNMILSFIDEMRNYQAMNFLLSVAIYENTEGRLQKGITPGLRGKIPYRFSMNWHIEVLYTDQGPVHLLRTINTGDNNLELKTRNGKFRRRLLDESKTRLHAAGRNWEKNPATFILKDPMDENPPDYAVDINDLYSWFLEALGS